VREGPIESADTEVSLLIATECTERTCIFWSRVRLLDPRDEFDELILMTKMNTDREYKYTITCPYSKLVIIIIYHIIINYNSSKPVVFRPAYFLSLE